MLLQVMDHINNPEMLIEAAGKIFLLIVKKQIKLIDSLMEIYEALWMEIDPLIGEKIVPFVLERMDSLLEFAMPLTKEVILRFVGVPTELFSLVYDIIKESSLLRSDTGETDDWKLGLKEEKYPWNPNNSTNMCEEAQKFFCKANPDLLLGGRSFGGHEANIILPTSRSNDCFNKYWNEETKTPGPMCNEFILSQM